MSSPFSDQLGLPLQLQRSVAVLLQPSNRTGPAAGRVIERAARYPRLRYMGSKYRVLPTLIDIFWGLDFDSVLDAFSGSGVVGYALKAMGKRVTTNDFLAFSATIARAAIENPGVYLEPSEVQEILKPNLDGRDFISRTFDGLYFPADDHAFLDSAWSHIECLPKYKRDIAISALCLSAARKQSRGVFTITDFRYNDGRRSMRTPLRDLFVEAVNEYNRVIIEDAPPANALCGDVFAVTPSGFDVVYLDPPYAPPRDDNDYIKRYHFLEGLSVYWRGQVIMEQTATKKLAKRYTPFGYKRSICDALQKTFELFSASTIVLSYSTNSVPDESVVIELLKSVKQTVEVFAVEHRYSFGTHSSAHRREARELIFVAK
jgi:DNA adenine methylase/adenine-specific DNA-methyltransferase